MWGLIVVHSKQVFHFNCVRYNKVPLHSRCVDMSVGDQLDRKRGQHYRSVNLSSKQANI